MPSNEKEIIEDLVEKCTEDKELYYFVSKLLENKSIRRVCENNAHLKEQAIEKLVKNAPTKEPIKIKRSAMNDVNKVKCLLSSLISLNGDRSILSTLEKIERHSVDKFKSAMTKTTNKNVQKLIKENIPYVEQTKQSIDNIMQTY